MARTELPAIAVLVLALLGERPMHPYQLFSELVRRKDDRHVRVNPGSVYRAVERLEQDGLVHAIGTDREGNRPERTTYEILPAGRAALVARATALIGEDHPTPALFSVGLSQAHVVDDDAAIRQLVRRRDREAARLADLRAGYEDVRARGLPRRYLLDAERDLAHLDLEVAWLHRTIEELRSGALAPFGGDPEQDWAPFRAGTPTGTPAVAAGEGSADAAAAPPPPRGHRSPAPAAPVRSPD